MIDNPGLRWALTILFVVSIGLYGRLAIRVRAPRQRVGWSLHVLMSAAMIAMAWPLGMSIPTLLYVLVFTAGALYFGYFGVFGPHVDHAFYHAAMMAAMVMMAVAMTSVAMPAMSSGLAMGAGHDMAMTGAGAPRAGGSWAAPTWVSVTCGVAAVGFLVVALWSFLVLVRGPQRPYANLLMSLGMGAMFAAMAI
ncbi:MAG TPA: DUF5134 domain-containing protein [Mycobacterium sp.]|nr:DUF5134 domain-containing protein [Mycobacterium sp.]